jgi:hypothetical protein
VPATGNRAIAELQAQWDEVARGEQPGPERLEADLASAPLAIGADGVMVPFRPQAGQTRGKTRWQEIKVGGLARLGQHRTRTGQRVMRLSHRRLVAVWGASDPCKPRLGLAALRQGLLSASEVVWLSEGGRGLWRLYDERFAAHAQGIVDFYHVAQTVWSGGVIKNFVIGKVYGASQPPARVSPRHGAPPPPHQRTRGQPALPTSASGHRPLPCGREEAVCKR